MGRVERADGWRDVEVRAGRLWTPLLFSGEQKQGQGLTAGGGGGAGGWQRARKAGIAEEERGGGPPGQRWSVGGQPAPAQGVRAASTPASLLPHTAAFSLPRCLSCYFFLIHHLVLSPAFSRCPFSLLPPHPHGCRRPLPALPFLMSVDPLSRLPSALSSFF